MTVGQSKRRRPTRNLVKDNAPLAKHLETTAQDIADLQDLTLPVGTILMFDGTGWVDNSTLPGFYVCDGRSVPGGGNTPNLVGLFMKGAATSGTTTAAATHTHTIGAPSATQSNIQGGGAQTLPTPTHIHTAAATTAPDPANYTVIFVKKMHG